jgi:hypothetical protein
VDADLTFGQLTLDKLPIQNAALKANGQGGLLTLKTCAAGCTTATSKPRAPSMCARARRC